MRVSTPTKDGSFVETFHYEMMSDPKRIGPFKQAIENIVGYNDIVLDVGAGTGILGLIAGKKAKKVYAVEKDPKIASYAKKSFERSPYKNKFELIIEDALKVNIPEKVDVIICEMLDTALITEPQVPVMNHVRQFLKLKGKIIPEKCITFVSLTEFKYEFYGACLRVPSYVRRSLPKPKIMSPRRELFVANFYKKILFDVEKELEIPVSSEGIVNSVKLDTYIILEDNKIIKSAPTLNCPLIFPLKEDIHVKNNDNVNVTIKYKHGGGFDKMKVLGEII